MIDAHKDRRSTDNTQNDIRTLIMEMPEQKDKAILLILLRMAENLESNNELMKGISEKVEQQNIVFDGHEAKEQGLLNKAIGAGWMFSGLIIVIMAMSSLLFKSLSDDYKTLGITVAEHTVRLTAQRKDIDLLQEANRIQEGVQKGPR